MHNISVDINNVYILVHQIGTIGMRTLLPYSALCQHTPQLILCNIYILYDDDSQKRAIQAPEQTKADERTYTLAGIAKRQNAPSKQLTGRHIALAPSPQTLKNRLSQCDERMLEHHNFIVWWMRSTHFPPVQLVRHRSHCTQRVCCM